MFAYLPAICHFCLSWGLGRKAKPKTTGTWKFWIPFLSMQIREHLPLGHGCVKGKTLSVWICSLTSVQFTLFLILPGIFFLNYALSVIFCTRKKLINVIQVILRSTAFLFKYVLIDKYWLITFSNFWFIVQAQLQLTPHCGCSYHSSAFLLKPLCPSDTDWYKLSWWHHFIIKVQEVVYSFSFPWDFSWTLQY